MAIWVDVTTSLSWERPPVGIVRTELECARHLTIKGVHGSREHLCYYDREAGVFRRLSDTQNRKIDNMLLGRYGHRSDRPLDQFLKVHSLPRKDTRRGPLKKLNRKLRYCLDGVEGGHLKGWGWQAGNFGFPVEVLIDIEGKVIARTTADKFREDLQSQKIGNGTCGFEIPLSDIFARLDDSCGGSANISLKPRFGKPVRVGELIYSPEAFDFIRSPAPEQGPMVRLANGDTYITAGLDWDSKDFGQIYSLKARHGFRVIGFCYDMIPFYLPHLCVGDVAAYFAKHFTELSWCADGVVCISQASKNDFLGFVKDSGCRLPELDVVRLGSSIQPRKSREHAISRNVVRVLQDRFILYVSTIERRKSHETLYRAYVTLLEAGITDLPRLVFVGMKGWGVDDFLRDIDLDPRSKKYISILTDVDDGELDLLYRNCLFTVFPSLYEGWGLPIAESLTYAKYCIASNRASIPEIAPRVLSGIDPWDINAWAREIYSLSHDPTKLASLEEDIRQSFRPDTWSQFGEDVLDFCSRVAQRIE